MELKPPFFEFDSFIGIESELTKHFDHSENGENSDEQTLKILTQGMDSKNLESIENGDFETFLILHDFMGITNLHSAKFIDNQLLAHLDFRIKFLEQMKLGTQVDMVHHWLKVKNLAYFNEASRNIKNCILGWLLFLNQF